jgi:hypothetical protein
VDTACAVPLQVDAHVRKAMTKKMLALSMAAVSVRLASTWSPTLTRILQSVSLWSTNAATVARAIGPRINAIAAPLASWTPRANVVCSKRLQFCSLCWARMAHATLLAGSTVRDIPSVECALQISVAKNEWHTIVHAKCSILVIFDAGDVPCALPAQGMSNEGKQNAMQVVECVVACPLAATKTTSVARCGQLAVRYFEVGFTIQGAES